MLETLPETAPTLTLVAPYDQTTPKGAVFGGWILSQIDDAAGLAGRKFAKGDVLIVGIKDLAFLAPLHAGEEFRFYTEVTRVGRSSFNLFLSSWAEPDGDCRQIMTADVALVAVDEAGKPRKLAD